MKIWVDAWQLQCCGEPIVVGRTVEWSCSAVDSQWLTSVVGKEAQSVQYAEEHHDEGGGFQLSGVVSTISAVYCSYQVDPQTRLATPIPGSSTRRRFDHVQGDEGGELGRDLVGYLVSVEPH